MAEFHNKPANRSEIDITEIDLPAVPAAALVRQYRGPRDVGRAESLYQSALTKPELSYVLQLLFTSLVANPEHDGAFTEILARIPAITLALKKGIRVNDLLTRGPADAFISALAVYCGTPSPERALDCAAEAAKIGLNAHAIVLGKRVLLALEESEAVFKTAGATRLIDLFESAGDLEDAVRAAQWAVQNFPDDMNFPVREKNLLASLYLKVQKLSPTSTYRENLQHPAEQQALHRATDQNARVDELEQKYRNSKRLEDFHELIRALRESSAPRREAALETLREGLDRYAEKETLWFTREIELERRWSEVRLHQQLLLDAPDNSELRAQHEALRLEVINAHIDHLYELASALPPGPDRSKRELELAQRLYEAGRFEEAVKQAQSVKRRPERRMDAWVIMAKSFVQLGLTLEAGACFQSVLSELSASSQSTGEQILEAKYSYAELLVQEARRRSEPLLAQQARKLCSEVMLEDIDYRSIRKIAAESDSLSRG